MRLQREAPGAYLVFADEVFIGTVVRHDAGYGVKVLWNAYLPGETDASFEWATRRRDAVQQLLTRRLV